MKPGQDAEDNGETAKPDRQGTGPNENQECRILDDRSGEKQTRGERKEGNEQSRWPEEKTREGSSTPNPETSAVADQHKTEETDGCGEGMKVAVGEGTERIEWSAAENSGGQVGQSSEEGVPWSRAMLPKDVEDTKLEGTDSGVRENVC